MHTLANLYFSIVQTTPHPIISFSSIATQEPLEAGATITDLPDCLVATDHPLYPGRNAWMAAAGIQDYLLLATLRKQGIAEELSISTLMAQLNIPYDPALGARSAHPTTPRFASTPIDDGHPDERKEWLKDKASIRFKVGTRDELLRDHTKRRTVRVAVEILEDGEWAPADHYDGFYDLPSFLYQEGSMHYASRLSEADTIQALRALQWIQDDDIFLWYDPEHLVFCCDTSDGDLWVFVCPKDDTPWLHKYGYNPFEDDLRGDALGQEPDFFDGDTMENTFAVVPGTTKAQIIAEMTAAGYTHDPSMLR